MVEKICSKCKEVKPIQMFFKRKSKLGFMSWCNLCKKTQVQIKRQERIDLGICKVCAKPKLRCSSMCLFHHVKSICKQDNHYTELLIDKLYSQRFECFYTGTLLLLGINASIDHICPISKFGSDDISNLVWVDFSVNRMKTDAQVTNFLDDFSNQLTEMNHLACIESQQTKHQKLGYVLGEYYPSNMVIT